MTWHPSFGTQTGSIPLSWLDDNDACLLLLASPEIDTYTVYGSATGYTDTTIQTAMTAVGANARLGIRSGTWVISNNLTVTTTLDILEGATLQIASGKTVTFNVPPRIGNYAVFTGSGTVVFATGGVPSKVYPQWWGAVTDTTVLAAMTSVGSNKATIVLNTTYTFAQSRDWSSYTTIVFEIPYGGLISHGSYTLALYNPPLAGAYQIFTGGGAVTITGYPQEAAWSGIAEQWYVNLFNAVTGVIATLTSTLANLTTAIIGTLTVTTETVTGSTITNAIITNATITNATITNLSGGGGYYAVRDKYRNLILSTSSASTNIPITADEIILETSAGVPIRLLSYSQTINAANSGANGLDTGSLSPSNWYHIWAIAKADGTNAGISSLSATAPTMPSGYIYKAYLGASYYGSGSTFQNMFQVDNKVTCVAVALTAGAATSRTSFAFPTIVPSAAKKFVGYVSSNAVSSCNLSPNNSTVGELTGIYFATTSHVFPFSLPLITPQTLYYYVSSGGLTVTCSGWEF